MPLSKTQKNIEEEFDKKFLFKSKIYGDPAVEYVNQANIIQDTRELKKFLLKALQSQRKEIIKILDNTEYIYTNYTTQMRSKKDFDKGNLVQEIIKDLKSKIWKTSEIF